MNNEETTRILWRKVFGVFQCEKCKKIMHYQFKFNKCPYCGRRVAKTDERGAKYS